MYFDIKFILYNKYIFIFGIKYQLIKIYLNNIY